MANKDLTMTATVISPEALLKHWQGHRGLTRKTIEAFPEDKLFTYSVGGMRPFSELVYEFLGMAVPGVTGIATGKWGQWADAAKVTTKKELLELWDKATEGIDNTWSEIPSHRFEEEDVAWTMARNRHFFYFLFYR